MIFRKILKFFNKIDNILYIKHGVHPFVRIDVVSLFFTLSVFLFFILFHFLFRKGWLPFESLRVNSLCIERTTSGNKTCGPKTRKRKMFLQGLRVFFQFQWCAMGRYFFHIMQATCII